MKEGRVIPSPVSDLKALSIVNKVLSVADHSFISPVTVPLVIGRVSHFIPAMDINHNFDQHTRLKSRGPYFLKCIS